MTPIMEVTILKHIYKIAKVHTARIKATTLTLTYKLRYSLIIISIA